jgi:hypothetical protein
MSEIVAVSVTVPLFLLKITGSYQSIRPQRALPPRGEGGRTPRRIGRNGSGFGEFADVVGGTRRTARFDVAVFTGLGQRDGEHEEPEEGLRKYVTE